MLPSGGCCASVVCVVCLFFCFKQKTAYEMRISDWSSDVCSSDLGVARPRSAQRGRRPAQMAAVFATLARRRARETKQCRTIDMPHAAEPAKTRLSSIDIKRQVLAGLCRGQRPPVDRDRRRQRAAQHMPAPGGVAPELRSEEHPSELQSL